MAQVSGTTDTYDLVGIAEDVEDMIYDISPTDTPFLTMAKRGKASNTLHQWQTDALAAVATNRQIEGDDASYSTATPTAMLTNYTQIARKTWLVSRTADQVRKYGRDRESARLAVKYMKEIKRDVEYALVTNQASSAGGSGTARSSAGIESMIAGNRVIAAGTAATTPGYTSNAWAAPTDGTATITFAEAHLQTALALAWTDGGDPSVLMMNTVAKADAAAFAGANKFAGNYTENGRSSQGIVVGGVDLYISDFGEHRMVLNRYMRQGIVLCLDPEYIECAWLSGIKPYDLAKTGDADKKMLVGEFCLVSGNPDAHAKIVGLATS